MMDNSPTITSSSSGELASFNESLDSAKAYAAKRHSPNTIRLYQRGWSKFEEWSGANGRQALPADGETLAAYCASLGTQFRPATIDLQFAAVRTHY